MFNSIRRRIRIRKAGFKDAVHGVIDRTYFQEKAGITKEKRKIIFHSVVWGDEFLESFLSFTVPSLLQDGNVPQLAKDGYDLEYFIYTHPQQYEEVSSRFGLCVARLNKYMPVRVMPLNKLETGWWHGDQWGFITGAMIEQIERCINENAMYFDTRPDTIYGNWSITNAVRTVEGKNVCFAAAHPRLSRGSVSKSDPFAGLRSMDTCFENETLVDLAFEHGHESLLQSFDREDSNSTYGGLSIRKITDSTYSVIHNLPMVWLANFTEDDLKYFRDPWSTWDDRWDHRWANLLLRQNRLKVSGSSDLFFCVEPTSDDRALPLQSGLLNNDKFMTRRQRHLHNYVFNSFCSVWRGRVGSAESSGASE